MSISAADIKAASFASDVTELEDLTLAHKGIVSLGAINTAPRLTCLNLAFNSLASLAGLSTLQCLTTLNVSHNQLTSIAAAAALPSLASLNVSHNRLTSLSGLSACGSLKDLFLQGNQLNSAAQLQALSCLTGLQRLCLHPNPLSKQTSPAQRHAAIMALCPQLQVLDAAPISDAERAAAGASPGTAFDLFVAEASESGRPGLPPAALFPSARHQGPASRHSAPPSLAGSARGMGARLRGGDPRATVRQSSMSFTGLPPTSSPTSRSMADDGDAGSVTSGSSMCSGSSAPPSGGAKRHGRRGGSALMRPPRLVPPGADFATVLMCLPTFEGKLAPLAKGPPRRRAAAGATKVAPNIPPPDAQHIDWGCKYPKTGSRAISLRRDGSLSSHWPGGDLAITVDADYTATTDPGGAATASDDGTAASVALAYRMFAAFRGTGNVAVSWDHTGGFVQYPNGAIMMIHSTGSGKGTAYHPGGEPYLRWHHGAADTPDHVDCQLDTHLGVRLVMASGQLQVYLSCGGLQYLVVCGRNEAAATWEATDAGGPAFLPVLGSRAAPVAAGRATAAKAAAAAAAARLGDHGGVASTMAALDDGLDAWLQSKLRMGTPEPL